MSLDLKKNQKYLELKRKYGFDIAVLRKSDKTTSDEDLFKSLLLFDAQNKIYDAVNEYAIEVNGNGAELASLMMTIFNMSGEIVANIARQDPEYVVLFREIAVSQFDAHIIKDLIDGKPN